MAFDPTFVTKHGLIYIAVPQTWTRENPYLLSPLNRYDFHVDACVVEEMYRIQTHVKWEHLNPNMKLLHTLHLIIQSLIVNSLQKHREYL